MAAIKVYYFSSTGEWDALDAQECIINRVGGVATVGSTNVPLELAALLATSLNEAELDDPDDGSWASERTVGVGDATFSYDVITNLSETPAVDANGEAVIARDENGDPILDENGDLTYEMVDIRELVGVQFPNAQVWSFEKARDFVTPLLTA